MVIHPIHWFWTRFGIICPGFEISLLTHTHRQNGLECNCVCCAHSIKKCFKKTPSHRISVLVGLDNLQSSLSTDFIRATVSFQQKVAPMKTVYNQVCGFPRATETLFIERNTTVKNVLNDFFCCFEHHENNSPAEYLDGGKNISALARYYYRKICLI